MGSIVIVDDHPLVRVALKVILERNGHHIAAEADNGVDAIQVVRTHKPDLVILDLDLPQLDGLSVLTHFKANNFLVKTLILTSSDSKTLPYVVCMGAQQASSARTKRWMRWEMQ